MITTKEGSYNNYEDKVYLNDLPKLLLNAYKYDTKHYEDSMWWPYTPFELNYESKRFLRLLLK